MSWGTDYDFWDTPMGRAQDLIMEEILNKEVERKFEDDANKGE